MSRSICDNLEKDCLVANAAPTATHTRTQYKAVPFRWPGAFWAGRFYVCLIHFKTLLIIVWFRWNITLRRRHNGWAKHWGRSRGSVFGAWSAASVRAHWIQNTPPHFCAKFGELRPTFNEISSWSSIALMQVDPSIKKDVLRKIWLNWASRLLFITAITVDHWILDAAWRTSIQGWEKIGPQAVMQKKADLRYS